MSSKCLPCSSALSNSSRLKWASARLLWAAPSAGYFSASSLVGLEGLIVIPGDVEKVRAAGAKPLAFGHTVGERECLLVQLLGFVLSPEFERAARPSCIGTTELRIALDGPLISGDCLLVTVGVRQGLCFGVIACGFDGCRGEGFARRRHGGFGQWHPPVPLESLPRALRSR